MLKPRPVSCGGCFGIVSPSAPIEPAALEPGLEFLKERGYGTKVFPSVYEKADHLAGGDAVRAKDLWDAFHDPEVDAVLCSRGGYGAARLLDRLDFKALAGTRRLFVGYSDITTLHLALGRAGLATLHGPVGATFSRPRECWVYESFFRAVEGDLTRPEGAPTGETLHPGTAEGVVAGGCLRLLCDSLGTPDQVDPAGRILIVEDIGEKTYRIDAMLTQLLNAGLLQRAAGLVFGEFTGSDELLAPGEGPSWRSVVAERLGKIRVPTIVDYPFGHKKQILSLGLGIRAKLDADRGTLEFCERLCE